MTSGITCGTQQLATTFVITSFVRNWMSSISSRQPETDLVFKIDFAVVTLLSYSQKSCHFYLPFLFVKTNQCVIFLIFSQTPSCANAYCFSHFYRFSLPLFSTPSYSEICPYLTIYSFCYGQIVFPFQVSQAYSKKNHICHERR